MSNSLSDYEVFDAIGKGGFGTVRLARHIKSFRRVAIKIVDKDEMVNAGHTMQLRLEIRFLKLLNHPNIVKLLDVIETPMRISMVMEFGGIHLKEYVLANVKVMEHEAREIFRSIVKALNYLHAHCIVHRDVKPQNILIDTNRNVKLIDFGLASYFVHNSFLAAACGSLQYCAPELLERKNYCGPEVDTWSLGVVLYFMLCGRLPFDVSPVDCQNALVIER
ncbi:kinase-like domain-containing protein [Chytriomyces sp. MP71]|nr:kinase-like domain-containing protein [Chytriomyces sp. MP71]